MGDIEAPRPALLVLAAFSRHADALEWTRQIATEKWGSVAIESEAFRFDETSYYETSMGAGLLKMFFAFEELIDPERIAEIKHVSNELEVTYRHTHLHPEERPLNLDPGYITEAKLILATTKDRDHRIYLRDGIYAEGTLHYYHGTWQTRPWTYPDYQRQDYHDFFSQCRDFLRTRIRASRLG